MNRPDDTWHRLLNWTYGQPPSERLAGQILLAEGFTSLNPSLPLGGPDGGMDAICKKDGQDWIMAVYFPPEKKTFAPIRKKFIADLKGMDKNAGNGFAFVTNQKLTPANRADLAALCQPMALELFHLERITAILDQPHMAPVRLQFLYILGTPNGLLLAENWSNMLAGRIEGENLNANNALHPLPKHTRPSPNTSPGIASLLTWSSRIPAKLIGRDAEMADLHAWAEREDPVRLRVMHGGGGVGKTRLAVEFGDALRANGWAACLLSGTSKPFAFQPGQAGTLLIIDYPENQPQAVKNLFNLLKSDSMPGGKWRVLLLCRNAEIEQEIDQTVPHLRDGALAIDALATGDDAWDLFQAGSARMREVRGQAPAPALALARGQFDAWREIDPRHADPLIILAFALNLVDDPGAHGLGRADILQSVVLRERRRMEHSLAGFSPAEARGAILLKALAALTGGLGHADVVALKKAGLQDDEIGLPGVLALKKTALWENDLLPEMQPDILAAQLIHAVMQEYLATDACIGAWVWQGLVVGEPDDEQLRGRLRRLVRLSLDWTGQVGGQYCLIDALQVDHDMAARLESVFETNVQLEWPLFGLAVAVGRLRVQYWVAQAGADFARYGPIGPILARNLNNLAARLPEQGDRAGGLALIQRAVAIYDDLSRQNFAAYKPDLARSLNNLSLCLRDQCDRAGALAAIQMAVVIHEDLYLQNFAAYGPDLARSLNNLSVDLADQGDRVGALAALQRAVAIFEELSRQNFAAYGPDLAMSLNNLSNRLANQGDRAGALAAIQRAVAIREDLSRQNPAAYAPDLACSLAIHAQLSDDTTAITLLERAISLIAPHVLPGNTNEIRHKQMLEDLLQRRNT
jgi:tetratricopeptide (TPR) repeat protein